MSVGAAVKVDRSKQRDNNNKSTYTEVYRVECTTTNEDLDAIESASGIPSFGDAYGSTNAKVNSIATAMVDDGLAYTVTVVYAPIDINKAQQEAPPGEQPGSSPLDWTMQVSCSFQDVETEIKDVDLDDEPIVNSAGETFNNIKPTITQVLVVSLRRNEPDTFSPIDAKDWKNKVNSDTWEGCAAGTCLIANVSADRQYFEPAEDSEDEPFYYWDVSYEIQIADTAKHWQTTVLDAGLMKIDVDTPSGLSPILVSGKPVPEPVALKDGDVLPEGEDPVYLEFRTRDEIAFSGFSFVFPG